MLPNESLQLTWARITPREWQLQTRAHAAELGSFGGSAHGLLCPYGAMVSHPAWTET